MANKKREKREQVHKERIRQLRTNPVSQTAPPQNYQPPARPAKKASLFGKAKDDVTLELDPQEAAFRQEIGKKAIANYEATTRQVMELMVEHQDLVDKLDDDRLFEQKAYELFAKPEFSQFKLNRAAIDYVSKKIGGFDPTLAQTNPEGFLKQMELAMKALPKSETSWLATALMSQVPELIKQGRVEEALIASVCMFSTAEDPTEPNPYTIAMLLAGLDAYESAGRQELENMLTKVGINLQELKQLNTADLSSPELTKLIASKLEDEDLLSQVEGLVEQNPELKQYINNLTENMEDRARDLFEQPEATSLLYTADELKETGIVAFFNAKYEEVIEKYPGGREAYERDIVQPKKLLKGKIAKQVTDVLGETIVELSHRLAADKYVELLKTRLEEYQREHPEPDFEYKDAVEFLLLSISSTLAIKDSEERQERIESTPYFDTLATNSVRQAMSNSMQTTTDDEGVDQE